MAGLIKSLNITDAILSGFTVLLEMGGDAMCVYRNMTLNIIQCTRKLSQMMMQVPCIIYMYMMYGNSWEV